MIGDKKLLGQHLHQRIHSAALEQASDQEGHFGSPINKILTEKIPKISKLE